MKHLYSTNTAAFTLQPIAKALGTALSSKIILFLLLGFFMLVSGEGFGQTFTSHKSGEWNNPETWGKTPPSKGNPSAGIDFPGGNNDVEILGGHKVRFNITKNNERKIKSLTIEGASPGTAGQPDTYLYLLANTTLEVTGSVEINGSGGKRESYLVSSNPDNGLDTNGSILVSGNLIIGDRGEFSGGSGTHTVIGNLSNALANSAKGNLNSKSSTIKIGGDFLNGGNFSAGTGTIEFNGTNQAIADAVYYNLTLSGTGTKTPFGGLNVAGTFAINSGVTFEASNHSHTINTALTNSGMINVAAASSSNGIRMTGGVFTNSGIFNAGGGTHNFVGIINTGTINASTSIISLTGDFNSGGAFNRGTTSNVIYNGANQNVAAVHYHGLEFAGTGLKTAQGDISVHGDLVAASTVALNPNSKTVTMTGGNQQIAGLQFFTLTLAGSGVKTAMGEIRVMGGFNIASGPTFNPNNLQFVYNGSDQSIANKPTYYGLTLRGTGMKIAMGDIDVASQLRVENVIFDTDQKVLTLGPDANILSVENATQHIVGIVETKRTVEQGANELFGNIGFRIIGSEVSLGSVKVRRVTGQTYTSPLTGYNSEKRQFYISSESGMPSDGLTTAIDMRFPDYELEQGATYDIYRVTENNTKIDKLVNSSTDPDFKYKVSNAQKFGMYTISNSITPLPVELVSFKAQRHAQGVSLTWVTASEQDNSGFEVQVSLDGRNFQKLGFVESKVGTTLRRQNYSFLDTKAVSGTRYYRLKQIDFDGKFEYSAIRAVSLDGDNGVAAAYPNPFDDVVTVRLTGTESRQVKAVLMDAMGKVILETVEETAGNSISVNTARVTTRGMYVLHVLDNGTRHTFKLMKR
jgi:hypothetical protein